MPARKTLFPDASGDLFAPTPAVASAPAGFRYAPDLFSPAAEQGFVATFETLPFKPFEFHGYQGNRRIVSYGYRYDYAGRALRTSEAMPDFLAPLREVASQFSGIAADKLEQALVTEYAPGAGIGWHRDKPMFEDVVALVLYVALRPAAAPPGRHRLAASGRRNRAALGLSPARPRAQRMGAQHRADGRAALFGDVSLFPSRITPDRASRASPARGHLPAWFAPHPSASSQPRRGGRAFPDPPR